MQITYLELPARELQAEKEYYSEVLGLPVKASAVELKVQVGKTELVFTQATPNFDGAYHFAFDIPEKHGSAAAFHCSKILKVGMSSRLKAGIRIPSISKTRQGMCSSSLLGTRWKMPVRIVLMKGKFCTSARSVCLRMM